MPASARSATNTRPRLLVTPRARRPGRLRLVLHRSADDASSQCDAAAEPTDLISVVIPVKNGGTDLVRCLNAIAGQRIEEEVEVVVVDSESQDGSAALAKRFGARVHSIPASEFHHGRTRNLGAQLARGDILVFTSQDAYAASDTWLARLIAPFRDDDTIAGVYGRQLPHEDARPPERYFLDFVYGLDRRLQRLEPEGQLSFEVTLFSNVNSALPRSLWEAFPFADDIVMSEDQEWSRRVSSRVGASSTSPTPPCTTRTRTPWQRLSSGSSTRARLRSDRMSMRSQIQICALERGHQLRAR